MSDAMLISRADTWHPWHRPINQMSAPADYVETYPMTETPEQSEQDARFLRGIGQWGGWTMNYSDPRLHAIERMEARGDVQVDRTNTGHIVVTLTAQSASWAPVLSAHSDLQREAERLTAQIESVLNEMPRIAYPALQAAAREMDEVLHEEGTNEEMLRDAALHLLKALYDTKLVTKPSAEAS